MEKRFGEIETKLDGKADKGQVDHIITTLDGISKRLDDGDQEMAAVKSQLERHEGWHHQAADKLGLQLDY